MQRKYNPKMLILTKDVCLRTVGLKQKIVQPPAVSSFIWIAFCFNGGINWFLSDNYTFSFGGTRWSLSSLPSHFMSQKHTEVAECRIHCLARNKPWITLEICCLGHSVPANQFFLKFLKFNAHIPREPKSNQEMWVRSCSGWCSTEEQWSAHHVRMEDFKALPAEICGDPLYSKTVQEGNEEDWHPCGILEVSHFLAVSDRMLDHCWIILLGLWATSAVLDLSSLVWTCKVTPKAFRAPTISGIIPLY